MDTIEPKIYPLVEALNQTGLIRTFSSCEGHFALDEQTLVDRNRADVRFVPADGITNQQVERFLSFLLIHFKRRHGVLPVHLIGYKLFTPVGEDAVDETFVVELRPFNRFDSPDHKRADIDRAIEQLVQLMRQTESTIAELSKQ